MLEKMLRGIKSEEVKKIIRNNKYFICCSYFLNSESVSMEKKKKIINFLCFIVKEKVIIKGGEGDNFISESVEVTKEIKKKVEDDKELRDMYISCDNFMFYVRNEGWKEGKSEKSLEEEIKKLKKEKEEVMKSEEREKKEKEEALKREKEAYERLEKEQREKMEIMKEKERLNEEKEELLKEKEELLREKEKIKEELCEERSKNSSSINEILNRIENITSFSFSSLPLTFSNDLKLKREDNKIIHYGDNGTESCIFEKEMKKV